MKAQNQQARFWEILLRPTPPWRAIIGFFGFLALCLLVGAGKALIPLYPFLALLTGIYLYFNATELYVGFTFWLLFLGPVIRRIIDYQAGRLTPGPWVLGSMLVASISLLTLTRELPKFFQDRKYQIAYYPFLLCFGCYFYAFLNGLTRNPLNAVIINFMFLVAPLAFGFHLFVNWSSYPEYKQAIRSSFLWGVLVLGTYGVWQFLTAPAWDRFWMITAGMSSFGNPEPLGIRVMSTMNSPQAFATAMTAGLILLLNRSKSPTSLSASVVGYLTFLLSRARAGWFSFVIGIFFFAASLKIREQIRLLLTIVVMVLALSQLIYTEPFSSVILDRFSSLSDAESDDSLNARKNTFQNAISLAVRQFSGLGLGADQSGFGGRDGTILPTLFIFGWIGLVFFLGGLILLLARITSQSSVASGDLFSSASLSITYGIIAQAGFNYIIYSSIGVIFWSFLGITLASHKYHLHIQKSKALSNTYF